jgi:acyl-CoA synthetase (NDP forming)
MVQAIDRILNAKSVAVVGASSDPRKRGYMTLETIIKGGYEGTIYPVNSNGGEILGLPVYRSLRELPQSPDIVVVVVPATSVPDVLQQAGEMGIFGAVILSAGFREAGRQDLEREIIGISQRYGFRIAGPNIQGINYLANKLCAMFFPVITTKGPIGIISQSGSVTATLSEWAADEGLGISAAINLGNQVDLCESDYLNYLATDENTKAIAMYLEGVKDGRQFLETIRRVAPKKPIIILKSGRTPMGQRSVASHTGSFAGSHQVFSAACRQFGVIDVSNMEALYDGVKVLATLKPPSGNRIFIITTSGGTGAIASDEADDLGLSIPVLSESLIRELERLDLSPVAKRSNPCDLTSISAEHFKQVALIADKFDVADVILINFSDPVKGGVEVVKHLAANVKASLAVSYMGGGEEERVGRVSLQKAGIPVFPTPERAMRGIAAAVWMARYRKTRREQ